MKADQFIRIQIKVYDYDGKRFSVQEVKAPRFWTAERAEKFLGAVCYGIENLRQEDVDRIETLETNPDFN